MSDISNKTARFQLQQIKTVDKVSDVSEAETEDSFKLDEYAIRNNLTSQPELLQRLQDSIQLLTSENTKIQSNCNHSNQNQVLSSNHLEDLDFDVEIQESDQESDCTMSKIKLNQVDLFDDVFDLIDDFVQNAKSK